MRECWAAALGDCKGDITGEHIVSRSVFIADKVRLRGLPWCKAEPKVIGLSAATANVLCAYHNSALGEVDEAAGRAVQAMRDCVALDLANRKLMPWVIPKFRRYVVDAARLERWMLKTLLNLVHGAGASVSRGIPAGGEAPREYAELAFGRRACSGHAGMFVTAATGMKLALEDQIQLTPITQHGKAVTGAYVALHGLRFVLNLVEDLSPKAWGTEGGEDWGRAVLDRPFLRASFKHYSFPSHALEFDWSGVVKPV